MYKQPALPLVLASLCISLAAFSVHASQANAEEGASRLLPEAAAIVLDLKAPELDELKQNVYVGLLAIGAPEGMDYMEIGAQVVLNNYSLFKQAMDTRSVVDMEKFDSPSKHYGNKPALKWDSGKDRIHFPYACRRLDAPDCIGEVLAKKEQLSALMKKEANITLMQRYKKILGLPHYQAHYYTLSDPLPQYQYQVTFSCMRLTQALFAFDEGNVDAGFELLGEEMAATKRMLRENESLIGHTIAVVMLYPHYHTISVLMDTPQMKPYLQDPRLLALLAPLTIEEQKALSRSFTIERNNSLYSVYMLDANSSLSGIDQQEILSLLDKLSPALSETEKRDFLNRLEQSDAASDYDRHGTVNMFYRIWEPVLQRAGMSTEEVTHLYTQNRLENLQEAAEKSYQKQLVREIEVRKNNPRIPLNITGRILTDIPSVGFESSLQRFYDVQSYILLVNAKHQILSRGLESSEVEPFLKSAGKATQNPMTGERFAWDATAGTLSTDWLSKPLPSGAREICEKGKCEKENMPRNTVYLKLNH